MQKNKIFYFFTILLFFCCLNTLYSQCAGEDNTITICDKELNNNYQQFNLFNHLKGIPTNGGIWSVNNPANQNALDINTGILNLWAINKFGEHSFTYTNANCNQNTKITIFLGGYPGENNIDGGANACSSNSSVDLFKFLDNKLTNLNADLNGKWTEKPATQTGFLTDQFFNAAAAGIGTYTFFLHNSYSK
ncbi:hypothetical protein [Tenacibaculum aestuariivivum]|uniref:hypothetical protein n=1 Tax=Tenacibaculum aestuariivivum TaxID=2006131 RepID=UPI003AB217E0